MEKKYEILKDNFKEIFERKVYRIKALKDFGNVKKGDIGGFVESEKNLRQDGDCWIYDNAVACDHAVVCDNAKVCDHAMVCENTKISGNAIVKNCATICGNARVYDNAIVKNYVEVFEYARVYDNAKVCGNAEVCGNVVVCGNAEVFEYARVCDNAKINNHAKIKDENQWFVVENVGSRNDNITFYETDNVIYVNIGCFNGTLDEFIERVKITHKGNKFEKEYLQMAELAKVKLGGLNE